MSHDPPRIGRYELEGRLGAGGMGTVYLGRSPGGRPAAIKVIGLGYRSHPEALARFRREAETLRKVRSAFTATLIDSELTDPPYWLATEYIPGPTLFDTVEERGALPADECFKLLAALAEGLADIHAHGICHRDLKPHNVILSSTGPQLIDFGIARELTETGLTSTGIALGTAGYTAPELMLGEALTPTADVFALGATMTHAATGRPPYGSGSMESVAYRIMREDIDLDGVDERLADLLRACMTRDVRQRPTPARIVELCRTGRSAIVTDRGPRVRPAAAPPPPRRRNKAVPVAAAVVAALLLFGGGVATAMHFGSSGTPQVAAPVSSPSVTESPSAAASVAGPAPSATARSASPRTSPSRPATAAVTTVTSADGRCVQAPQDALGALAEARPCDGSGAQKWAFTKDGTIMRTTPSTKCLDVGSDGGANLAYKVQLWACNNTPAQLWAAQGDGTLYNSGSRRCLAILPNTDGGPALGVVACTGATAQRWKLPKA
jgi:serine/threonine protein kinase